VKLYFDGRPDEEDFVTIVGFGYIEDDDSYADLRELHIQIIKSKVCRGLFGDVLNTNLQFCSFIGAFSHRTSCFLLFSQAACRGDSGGPAIFLGRKPSDDIQVGIISFGSSECSTGSTVYSRVSGYENWIKQRVCIGNNNPD